jgi:drug/metabolite transporter (DMT)-like permease
MFDIIPLMFSGSMALIDSIVLSFLKAYSVGWVKWKGVIFVSMLFYSLQPVVFLQSLNYSTLTVMNLLWDVTSDIVVTIIGLLYFKEKISSFKKLGVIFSLMSIILLSIDDNKFTLQ